MLIEGVISDILETELFSTRRAFFRAAPREGKDRAERYSSMTMNDRNDINGANSRNDINSIGNSMETDEINGIRNAGDVERVFGAVDGSRFPLFDAVRHDEEVTAFIRHQNESMKALGYTEHSFAHVGLVTQRTRYVLETLDTDDHTIDLAMTAAWLHDIGNIVNRVDHSQSGAIMAFHILSRLSAPAEDIAPVMSAIGNHDEGTGVPVDRISAALILADKSDVRRNRVQDKDATNFDIHDRVNYSVTETEFKINQEHSAIKLKLTVDTRYSKVGEYFEIFMERMLLCKKAVEFLGLEFHLIINEQTLI